jgi:Uma2 family endonuclease
MATTRPWTVDDLDGLSDLEQFELIRGELIQLEMSSFEHTTIGARLIRYLSEFADANRLGLVMSSDGGIVFGRDPDTMLVPDVAFVSIERLPPRDTWGARLELAPDLAVEILSPSNRPAYVQRKLEIYLNGGVRLVWIVNPDERTVTVHRPRQASIVLHVTDVLDGENVLQGFRLPVEHIFALFGPPLT